MRSRHSGMNGDRVGHTARTGEHQLLAEPISHLCQRNSPYAGNVFGAKSGTRFSVDVADHECHRLAWTISHLEMRQDVTVQPGTCEFVDNQIDFGDGTNILAS